MDVDSSQDNAEHVNQKMHGREAVSKKLLCVFNPILQNSSVNLVESKGVLFLQFKLCLYK